MTTYGSKTCRVEFLSKGFKTLLYSSGVRDTVYNIAQQIARDAGDGFQPGVFYAKNYAGGRVVGTVNAVTPEAREAQAERKVLHVAAVKPRSIT